jgi:hypothetical protein
MQYVAFFGQRNALGKCLEVVRSAKIADGEKFIGFWPGQVCLMVSFQPKKLGEEGTLQNWREWVYSREITTMEYNTLSHSSMS